MNKGTVLCLIRSSHRFVDDVVVVPTGYFGQWLVTIGADAQYRSALDLHSIN